MKRWTMALSVLALAWIGCDRGSDGGSDTASPSDTESPVEIAVDTTAPVDITDVLGTDVPETQTSPDLEWADGGVTTGPMAPCLPAESLGGLKIKRDTITGEYSLVGAVTDGPCMADKTKKALETEGGCTLWEGLNQNFCDPQCINEECGEDGDCHPAPDRISVGKVTLEGLKEAVSAEPDYQNGYWTKISDDIPYLIGASIELTATGDVADGFTLTGAGIVPIQIGDKDWIVEPDKPFTANWEPSDGPGKIYFELNVDQHGTTPVTLKCTVEDTGTYTVSAEFMKKFVEYGASGAARGEIWRKTTDSVNLEQGCVEFEVTSLQTVYPKCKNCPCTIPGQCPE